MKFLIDGVFIDESDVTQEQWDTMYNDTAIEQFDEDRHVDLAEIEQPPIEPWRVADFEQEFLRDCD